MMLGQRLVVFVAMVLGVLLIRVIFNAAEHTQPVLSVADFVQALATAAMIEVIFAIMNRRKA